jgi:4-hydroxythreonine-4-phosphate dehydrogenase
MRIGITLGDPSGIGPEIATKAVADPRVLAVCEPVLYGPPDLSIFPPGQLSADAGRAAFDAIARAVGDATAGRIAAIVTCPVNKEAFAMAGLPWRGHTDLLAHLTGTEFVAMMFYSPTLLVFSKLANAIGLSKITLITM